ncbi:MAG TPA: hypothetical protein VFD27_11315 [Chthoniobacteraceae bacterium]|nr:hypothetical protein [Chthoniobacteraceae bacterium]
MKLHPRSFSILIATALLVCAATSSLHADDIFWNSFFDASFNDASKWTGGVPGMDDVAHFGRTNNPLVQQASYTVDFDVSPTNQRFLIEDDFVIFDLNSRTYTTTLVAGSEVGNVAGRAGRLTVMNGTLALGTNSLFEVGAVANASGFFTVTTGAIVNGTPFLAIGETGSGTLTVLNGGRVNAGLLMLGSNGTATGTASITGANTILDIASGGTTSIGAASGTTDMLTAQSGGTFSSGTGAITIGATGTVAILGGTFNAAGDMTVNGLVIRDSGGAFNLVANRTLTVQNGGDVSITGTFIQPVSATITITGIGSTFSVTSILEMEGDSSITNVLAGGSLSSGTAPIFLGQASAPTVNVDGSGSTFSGGNLFLGVTGGTLTFTNGSSGTFGTISVADSTFQGSSGVFRIQSGATASGTGLSVATTAVSHTGTVTVTGAGSALTLTDAGTLNLGASASSTGRLNVQNGGTFTSGTGAITIGKTGTVAITGGTFNANGDMTVNGLLTRDSTGDFNLAEGKTLTVQNGGGLMITSALFHDTASTITITGVGSTLTATAALFLNGGSTTNVLAGGRLSAGSGAPLALIASAGFGNTTVLVDGSSSTFAGGNGTLGLGEVATGTLTFSNGSSGSFGPINVAGLTNSSFGNGTLNIQSGATLTGSNLNVALGQSATTGTITITGAGSALTLSNTATIGAASASTAAVNVQNGGTFTTGTGLTTVNATGDLNVLAGGTMIVRGDMIVHSSLDIAGTVILDDDPVPAPALGAIADVGLQDFEEGEFGGGNPSAGDSVSAVPEPNVAMLVLTSLGILGIRRRNKLPLFPIANHATQNRRPP